MAANKSWRSCHRFIPDKDIIVRTLGTIAHYYWTLLCPCLVRMSRSTVYLLVSEAKASPLSCAAMLNCAASSSCSGDGGTWDDAARAGPTGRHTSLVPCLDPSSQPTGPAPFLSWPRHPSTRQANTFPAAVQLLGWRQIFIFETALVAWTFTSFENTDYFSILCVFFSVSDLLPRSGSQPCDWFS